MSRRRVTKRKPIPPDAKYSDQVLARFINYVMRKGKKSTAEALVYDCFDMIEKKTGQKGLEVFRKALDNVKPTLEVASRRVGGATYQIPIEVRPRRSQTLAVRWLVEFARKRKEPTMAARLANEILDAANRTGAAVKRREDVHKMAESNKAFAHYRW